MCVTDIEVEETLLHIRSFHLFYVHDRHMVQNVWRFSDCALEDLAYKQFTETMLLTIHEHAYTAASYAVTQFKAHSIKLTSS